MNPKPAPFRALLGCELRRLWRGVVPWLFVAAVPMLFALPGCWQAPALERHLELVKYLPILGLAFSAFAAWATQRGRRSGSDEIILAWPVSSARLHLARTLALGSLTVALWLEATLPSLAYAAISYITAARAAALPMPVVAALRDAGLIALSLAASFLGAQATGQLAGALLPGVTALVALVLYRAFALIGPRLAVGTLQWPYAQLVAPEFLWEGSARLARGLYVGLYADLFAAHQAFWVLGSLGALAAVATLSQVRRDVPRTRPAAAAALGLMVVAASALPFVAVERPYVASHARALAAYGEAVKPELQLSASPPAAQEDAAPAPTPLGYDLAVDLSRPPAASVAATVEMSAGAGVPRDSLTLTLRRAFEVDEVRLDGAVVPFTRDGDLLRLQPEQPLPAERPFSVSLRYHGTVADWRLDPAETPAALAAREFVWLPSTWGWYPVPGEQPLTWEIGMSSMVFRALADRTTPFNDAEPAFDVGVRAPAGVRFLAGFVQDEEGTWHLQASRNQLTLLGGNWWPRGEGAARFAVRFEELDTWQASMADVQLLFTALADWTGIAPLTVVPSPLPFSNAGDRLLVVDTDLGGMRPQGGTSRERLAGGGPSWLYGFIIRLPLLAPFSAQELDPASRALGEDLALRAYVQEQVIEDAFGPSPGITPFNTNPDWGPLLHVKAWAARTPREVQKAVLRRLFHDAPLRQLTLEDLAFLDEGAE